MSKQDMFGIEDGGDDGDAPEMAFVILQVTPAEGWNAVFDNGRLLGLACFALVEMIPPPSDVPQLPMRTVRPMAANEIGEIDDVDSFDGFVALIPPGGDVKAIIAKAHELQSE